MVSNPQNGKDLPPNQPDRAHQWHLLALAICFLGLSYTHIQHSLFNAGIAKFGHNFHIFDSILYSFLQPMVIFVTGTYVGRIYKSDSRQFFQLINQLIFLYVTWSVLQGLLEISIAGVTGKNLSLLEILTFPWNPRGHFDFLYGVIANILVWHLLVKKWTSTLSRLLLITLAIALYLNQSLFQGVVILKDLSHFGPFYLAGLLLYPHLTPNQAPGSLKLAVIGGGFAAAQYLFHSVLMLESYNASLTALGLSFLGIFTLYQFSQKLTSTKPLQVDYLLLFFIAYAIHIIPGFGVRILLTYGLHNDNATLHFATEYAAAVLLTVVFIGACLATKITLLIQAPRAFNVAKPYQAISQFFTTYPKIRLLSVGFGATLVSTMAVIYTLSELALNTHIEAPTHQVYSDLSINTENVSIEEGQRLSRILGCTYGCHGVDLSGGIKFDIEDYGTVYSANLSVVIKNLSLKEFQEDVRFGVNPQHHKLARVMPSHAFYYLKPDELTNIYAFLRTQPENLKPATPNKHSWKQRGVLAQQFLSNDNRVTDEHSSSPQTLPEGERLAKMACSECHGKNLMGSSIAPPLLVAQAYSLTDFNHLLKDGKGLGERELSLMSQTARLRFSNFNPEETAAIHQYLQTLTYQP